VRFSWAAAARRHCGFDRLVRMRATPLLGDGLVVRSVTAAPRDVVFIKSIFEASEGVGAIFAERGGDLVIAAPASRERELDELLRDLAKEVEVVVEESETRAACCGRLRDPLA